MEINLTDIVPHRAPMLILDRVISYSENNLTAAVKINEDSYGFEKNAVPAWYGIEYMAQAIAAFNGLNFSKLGQPEIGFLVGVRNFKTATARFAVGMELEIYIEPNFIVENSGSFVCAIKSGGEILAEATLTTYKPNFEYLDKIKGEINEQQ